MNSQEIKKLDAEYVLDSYARFDLCLVRGKGCRAYDAEDNVFLDFTSGIGVNSLGWADEKWAQAVAQQASCLQHTSNIYYTKPSAELAQILCQKSGMKKAFFANSGAEANEGAIKTARKYSRDKYHDKKDTRNVIITLENSFHGRTMATLSATGQDYFHHNFHPFLQGFVHVPAGDIEAMDNAMNDTVCAVMLEVIQGEGGVVPLPKEYILAVQKLCNERDILLIVDEVQTGVGRTGTFLASQQVGIVPDVVTLAKGIGGGLPMGAVLFGEKTQNVLGRGDHATTYGGNPVACAGALAVMERLNDSFLAEVKEKGVYLKEKLMNMPGVAQVNGEGLMLGILFKEGIVAADVLRKAMEKGMLCLLAKDKLRLLPPLVITKDEIDEGITILNKVLEDMA